MTLRIWNEEILSDAEAQKLKELALQYAAENDGISPDSYDDLNYNAITYAEFVSYIKEALRRHCTIEDVVDRIAAQRYKSGIW